MISGGYIYPSVYFITEGLWRAEKLPNGSIRIAIDISRDELINILKGVEDEKRDDTGF